jgi:hypothetical protein
MVLLHSTLRPKSFISHPSRVPHTPGFPVKFDGVGKFHAAFLNESRTLGRRLEPRTGNPGISLVFREMWDTAAFNPKPSTQNQPTGNWTSAPRSPRRTWAEKDGAKPLHSFG